MSFLCRGAWTSWNLLCKRWRYVPPLFPWEISWCLGCEGVSWSKVQLFQCRFVECRRGTEGDYFVWTRSWYRLLQCRYIPLYYRRLTFPGAAIPGFFADQSIETLDFMMKNNYYTALWTAHVISCYTTNLTSGRNQRNDPVSPPCRLAK